MQKFKNYLTEEAFILFVNILLYGVLAFVLLYFIFTIFVLKIDFLDGYKVKASEYVPVPAVISNMGALSYSDFISLKNTSAMLTEDEFNNLIAERIILEDYLGDDYVNYVRAEKRKLKLYILSK